MTHASPPNCQAATFRCTTGRMCRRWEIRNRRRHRMRRHVELRAGVAVDDDDVAVIGAERSDLRRVELERGERRPGAWVLGGDEEREVDESRSVLGGRPAREAVARRNHEQDIRSQRSDRTSGSGRGF